MPGDYQPGVPRARGQRSLRRLSGRRGRDGRGRLYDVLAAAVRSKGAEVRLDTPGRELVQDKQTGEILGVVAGREGETLRVRARRGVVLATGGFEANPQMVRDYQRLSDPPVWGSPAGTGDGIKMAQKVGADLWHMHNMMSTIGLARAWIRERILRRPSCSPSDSCTPGRMEPAVSTNFPRWGTDRRFFTATTSSFPISRCTWSSTRPHAWPGRSRHLPRFWTSDGTCGSKAMTGAWTTAPRSRRAGSRGDTIAELPARIGVDAMTLEETVARYNRACEAKVDEAFGRSPPRSCPSSTLPSMVSSRHRCSDGATGGPRRNEKSQVLEPFAAVIPRLYAAGCISSTTA